MTIAGVSLPRMRDNLLMADARTFDDILAEGRALAEQRIASGLVLPVSHRARRLTFWQVCRLILDAWSETRGRWKPEEPALRP